jgi:predicted branched-subunit amino acid permease
LALGATLAATGLHPLVAWSSSPLLFGGAAQLLAVQLLDAGASAAVVVVGALVVNARMLLYSASLAPHVRSWPGRWRWAGAYFLADPVYALAIEQFRRPDGDGDDRDRLVYYFAAGLTLWTGWQLITAAGLLLAGVLPASLRLELAAPLTFLLLLLPMLIGRAAYAAAAVGGTVAVAASGLPLGLGLLAGAMAGMVAGALVGGRHA